MFVYAVIIAALLIGSVFAFLFMTVVGRMQEACNPIMQDNYVVDESYYDAFGLAVALVTNIWTYIFLIILFVLGYWVYIYQQRSSVTG